ncbi:tetraacyldisaccharide 4'-kinase [Candidatus Pelagibacter sp.]|uniref:tetraacyldisaccharide 4'-kinase n=1 Tax=Candidatus Pelagibacter sp. TaxID=2024849 RepID=UPI003F866B43
MKFKKPNFWDYKKPNLVAYLLSPLSLIVRINNLILNTKPKKKFENIKTICVGNIYLGGTGKTPTVIKLYEIFKNNGIKVCTAKKFYPDQKDENSILKNRSKFISLDSRQKIVQKAIEENCELLIFDDGLQDRQIDYNFKLVCFDYEKWIGNGFLIPSGPMREKIDSLKKYDAVIIKNINKKSDQNEIYKSINKINPNIRIFNSFFKIKNKDEFNLNDKFLIFSGIGNSNSFKEILIKNNFNIIKEIVFPDHFNYKKHDILNLIKIAENKNIKIITTEKDFVKIPTSLREKINFIKIDLEILEQKQLTELIQSKISEIN